MVKTDPTALVASSVASPSTLGIATLSSAFTETASTTLRVTRQVRYCNKSSSTTRVLTFIVENLNIFNKITEFLICGGIRLL